MRIALTIVRETGRISPMFEAAGLAIVLDCCRGAAQAQVEVPLPALPEEKAEKLAALGVRVLLCGAIANETASMVQQHGLALHSFAAGDWREVMAGWQAGRHLQECHLMPGCGGRRRQHRCRRGGGHSWRQQ
jgi:predicted Fe-Mo cluster-binding NifX family protein